MISVAYLSSLYPSLSQAFLEREITALRELGADVQTFSVRAPKHNDLLSEAHQRAARETWCILESPARFARLVLGELFRRPAQSVRALIRGQQLSPPGVRARLLHIVYTAEAIVLAHVMRQKNVRHVHVHFANNGATIAMLACSFDQTLSYSLSVHGPLEFYNVEALRLREKIAGASFVRCISNYCRAQVMSLCPPQQWTLLPVVHCGLDVERFDVPARGRQSGLRVLTVGRFVAVKGYPLVLEACRRLIDEGLDIHLDMVGEGPKRGELEAAIHRLQLTKRVTMSGAVGQDGIQQHFERADVMVVSSFLEGLPVVLMEALAKEQAVIATWVAGIPELVEHERSGLLIEPGSVDAICDALRRLYFDAELRRRLGREGREKVLRDFDAKQTAAAMLDWFQQCAPAGAR